MGSTVGRLKTRRQGFYAAMQHAGQKKYASGIKIALIVAGGRGERAGLGEPKQYRPLLQATPLVLSVQAFSDFGIETTIVAVAKEHFDTARAALARFSNVHLVEGGATRTASVRAGIAAAKPFDPAAIFIHDAARPGLRPEMLKRLTEALDAADGAAPGLPVADALKRADDQGLIQGRVDRDSLYRVQTPQAFRYRAIADAYAKAGDAVFEDDLAVAAAAGFSTRLIPGDPRLMKLTYPEDFAVLEAMMRADARLCVGSGFDAHRFGPGDHVTLCGVRIAHERGLIGHSDADAGWHALVDALLGAIGAGDIGKHFPPSEARWKGADSETFLRHARDLVAQAGAGFKMSMSL